MDGNLVGEAIFVDREKLILILEAVIERIFWEITGNKVEKQGFLSFDFSSTIVGNIKINGQINLFIAVSFPYKLAKLISAKMMEMDVGDIDGELMIESVKEVSNLVGGMMKNKLVDMGYSEQLGLPSVMLGKNYKLDDNLKEKLNRYIFTLKEMDFCVDLFM